MAKKGKITEDQYINLCNSLNQQIENAYQALKILNTNLNALMKGDSEGPYWNGRNAKDFYNTAKGNLSNDIKAYDEATDAWVRLRNRYVTLCKKGYFK